MELAVERAPLRVGVARRLVSCAVLFMVWPTRRLAEKESSAVVGLFDRSRQEPVMYSDHIRS